MSDYQKVTTHRIVVGATPAVMEAARAAAAEIARDFYADAIRKGRCDSDEIVLVAARAILAERERCAAECVLVPKDTKPIAWLGWFSGAGSENSHYEFTRHEETARRWSLYGDVTPLYAIPALAAAKKG